MRAENQSNGAVLATRVTVPGNFVDRARGWLGRSSLEPCEALWLNPCSRIHSVGMAFPIDVLCLNSECRVVAAFTMQPGVYLRSLTGTASVLELPAGTVAASGAKVGDQIVFV